MSPSLLANIPKRSKDCHERFRLDTGEWTDSSDESYTESEASSHFKFENTAMRMEYTDSNDVISVLPKQPPSNEL